MYDILVECAELSLDISESSSNSSSSSVGGERVTFQSSPQLSRGHCSCFYLLAMTSTVLLCLAWAVSPDFSSCIKGNATLYELSPFWMVMPSGVSILIKQHTFV